MDKGREPRERLLSSVTVETNNKNKLMLNHHKKAYFSFSHNSGGWMARAESQRGGQLGVRSCQTDYTNLSSWEMTRPWGLTHTLVRTISPFPQPCPPGAICFKKVSSHTDPQHLNIHQGDHGSTVRHSRGQSTSEAYQGGAKGQMLAIPPHSGDQRNANETKTRVHSSDYAKQLFQTKITN